MGKTGLMGMDLLMMCEVLHPLESKAITYVPISARIDLRDLCGNVPGLDAPGSAASDLQVTLTRVETGEDLPLDVAQAGLAEVMVFWTPGRRGLHELSDPLTNVDLHSQVLHPNWGVRRDVQRFLEENPSYTPQGWPDRDVPLPAESSARRGAGTSGGASWAFLSQRRRWLFLAGALATVLLSILCNQLSGVGAGAGGAAAAARQAGGGNVTMLHPPKGSRLEAWKTSEQLSVYVPPRGFDMDLAGQLFFACFWTGFTALWTLGAVQNGAPVMFAMFSLPFWGVGLSLLASLAKAPVQSEQMDLGLADYRFSKDWFGFVVSNVAGPIADLLEPPLRQVDGEHCELIFKAGLQEITFGTALHKVEAAWVQERVKQLLIGTEDGTRFNVQVPDRTTEAGQLPYGQHRVQSGGFHFGVWIR